jgi:hypothetical protein
VRIKVSNYFPYLAAGLEAFARQHFEYPYPDALQWALHRLSWEMIERHQREASRPTYPTSLRQTLNMFTKPLRDWWPGDLGQLPTEIEADSPLLSQPFEDESALEEQVSDYLVELNLPTINSINLIREELEQHLIRELLLWAREKPLLLADDYQTIRKFLIEHPYVNEQTFREDLKPIYYDYRKIENFYEPTEPFKAQLLHDGSYWKCGNCKGLLRWSTATKRQPYCVKRSCSRIDPDYQNKKRVELAEATRRLKTSYHLRVCLPGLVELKLEKALDDLAKTHNIQVTLWPGVDRYDLRVVLPKGEQQLRWAVDVKDYASARNLAQHIRSNPFKHFEDDPTLVWDSAFFVVPYYREQLEPGYVKQLKQRLKNDLPSNVKIMDDQKFLQKIRGELEGR